MAEIVLMKKEIEKVSSLAKNKSRCGTKSTL
jgi:hypothetical protein